MEAVTEVGSKAIDYLWNVILIILLCGTGIYFTIRLKFIQIRKFGEGFKLVFGNISLKGEKGKNGQRMDLKTGSFSPWIWYRKYS